ncbi:hypothetical protein ACFRFL_45685 [Streptomyces sp. NPDC056708]|uniref:hypothetical protein n=1 Tax=unclassified Streptomyces TaxID=2593676 RepID=UPI00369316EC
MGDGGESSDLCGGEEVEPSRCGFGGVDAVVCGLGGEQGAGGGRVVAGAGVADGQAGLEQGGVAGVLAGFAAGEGGLADAQGFAVVVAAAGVDREVGPGAGLGPVAGSEDGSLQRGGAPPVCRVQVPGVVGGPSGGTAQ